MLLKDFVLRARIVLPVQDQKKVKGGSTDEIIIEDFTIM